MATFKILERLTKEDWERLYQARKHGATYAEMCLLIGIGIKSWHLISREYASYHAAREREDRKKTFKKEQLKFVEKSKEQAIRLSGLGMTIVEVASYIGISESQLVDLMEEDLVFKHNYETAPLKSDSEIISALRKRALGYTYMTETETEILDRNGNSIGKTKVKSKRVSPPNIKAHEIWLVNRRNWRLNTEEVPVNYDAKAIEYDIREKMFDESLNETANEESKEE